MLLRFNPITNISLYIIDQRQVMYRTFLWGDPVQVHLLAGGRPVDVTDELYAARRICAEESLHLGWGLSADSHRGRGSTPSTRAFLAVRSVIYAEREVTVKLQGCQGAARSGRRRRPGHSGAGPTLCSIYLAGRAAEGLIESPGMLLPTTQPARQSCRACVRLRPFGVLFGFPGAGERRRLLA